MATACEEWVARIVRNQPATLVLAGPSGAGKTHCLTRVATWMRSAAVSLLDHPQGCWKRPPTYHSALWPETCALLANGRSDIIDDHVESAVLFLDDIGAENDPWKKGADSLCQILSRREFSFTMITTNVSPDAWREKFDVRIADRLLRNSRVVDMTGVKSWSVR